MNTGDFIVNGIFVAGLLFWWGAIISVLRGIHTDEKEAEKVEAEEK